MQYAVGIVHSRKLDSLNSEVENMFCSVASSDLFKLIERTDPELLGAIALISVVLAFALSITMVVTICRTYQNITLAKLQSRMLNDLLAKGYSVGEIQQLVYGQKRNVLARFFDERREAYVNHRPAPPVKSGS